MQMHSPLRCPAAAAQPARGWAALQISLLLPESGLGGRELGLVPRLNLLQLAIFRPRLQQKRAGPNPASDEEHDVEEDDEALGHHVFRARSTERPCGE